MRITDEMLEDPTEKDQLAIEAETLSGSQETTPIPVVIGTRIVAAQWTSRVYNQQAVQAKTARPDKK